MLIFPRDTNTIKDDHFNVVKIVAKPSVTNGIFLCVIVDGSWGQWSQWSLCSKTCGDGVHVRSRICDDPKPAAGGASCTGTSTQEKYCRLRDCCKLMSPAVH